MATEAVPGKTVTQDDSATLPSLIVSNFFTGATPLFEKLADLSAFAQVQYAYYASMGVGQPLLGPYEALGRGFAETEAFANKYGVLGSEFVNVAYNDVFGRAPTAEQNAHFQAQIDYFVSIYTKVGISADSATLFARGAAIGQMLGEAALNGTSVFDYAGAAKAFIEKMGDADFVPGQPLSNFDDAPVVSPGGGGSPPADTVDYTLQNGVLTLTANGGYVGTIDQANLKIVEPDGQTRVIDLAAITKIVLVQQGTKFNVDGAVLNGKAIAVDGAGVLNVTGVGFQAAIGATQFEPTVNLDQLIHSSQGFVSAQSQFLVNGSVRDAIKVQWDFWDDKYVVAGQQAYTNLEINEATIRLGVKYINDIDPAAGAGGNVANVITDIVGKASADGRSQLLHDNLLGNVGAASMGDRQFSDAKLTELKNLVRDEYENRPWISGELADAATAPVGVAKAFDFAKGFARPDYIMEAMNKSVDMAARKGAEMFYGDGNTVTGFNLVRHEGLGIELGLKAKERGGPDIIGIKGQDGLVHYQADTGVSPSNANRADWSFDFSVLTGLNGRSETLNNYTFKLLVDTDKSVGTSYQELKLTQITPGVTPWIDPAGKLTGFINDDDGNAAGSAIRSQNSVNFGFDWLKNIIDSNSEIDGIQPYDYSAGRFDILLVAEDKATGVKIVGTHIVVDVGALI